MTERPPYRPLRMEDVWSAKPNGLGVVSLFAGAGGSSLGYRMAGCRILWANEFIEAAREVYRANASPKTIVDPRDIREIEPKEILDALGLAEGEVDILDGSPPCASFSRSGKREKHWGKVKTYSEGAQRTDDLFFEYARILRGLRPRAFVAENVPGLLVGTAKGYFLDIIEELRGSGYEVEARVLDASRLGVPQSRKRLFFIGIREDLGRKPVFPRPLPYRYTLEEALADLRIETVDVPNSVKLELPETAGPSIRRFSIYPYWLDTPIGKNHPARFNLTRPNPKKPCPTVTSTTSSIGAAGVCHPTEPRKFSVAELRRIGAFPVDFELPGTYYQQVERIGRSVPPLVTKAIAEALEGVLK